MTTEIDRLNRIGAEIMGWKRIERDKYYPDDDLDYWGSEKEYYYSIKDWSPATDLNHTDMVKKELIKRGWEWTVENDTYEGNNMITVIFSKEGEFQKVDYSTDQESLAIMRAVEKAWEVGKKEK